MRIFALCSIAVLGAAAFCGCATTTPDESAEVLQFGEKALALTEARMERISSEQEVLELQMEQARDQRKKLLGDAKRYEELSSNAWTDTRLRDSQRAPEAKQYLQLAQNLEEEAEAYSNRINSINARLSELENERHNLRHRKNVLRGKEAEAQ